MGQAAPAFASRKRAYPRDLRRAATRTGTQAGGLTVEHYLIARCVEVQALYDPAQSPSRRTWRTVRSRIQQGVRPLAGRHPEGRTYEGSKHRR